jgi:hypothetical protein
MSEYKPPIKISADDPLCSASAVGNTVIGMLFEKTGAEIKGAITARIAAISCKIAQYEGMVQKMETFIEKKRSVLREMDKFQILRQDERRANMRPIDREIAEATKVVESLMRKRFDFVDDFNEETRKQLGKKALVFDEGFDEFQSEFSQLDDFMSKERYIVRGVVDTIGSSRYGYDAINAQGVTGIQGLCGSTGEKGISGSSAYYSPQLNESFLEHPKDSDEGDWDDEETEEDKAISRLGTLRGIIDKYMRKVGEIQDAIRSLHEEKRRLELIGRNLDDERSYKLDINKLSAFGFENID